MSYTWVLPFSRKRCPNCGTLLHVGLCDIVASDDTVIQEAPASGWQRLLAMVRVRALEGIEAVQKRAARRCPNPQCLQQLPHNIEYMGNLSIAIVGGARSGKSHFIASLLTLLFRDEGLRDFGCEEVIFIGDSLERYQRDYYVPLFLEHRALMATPATSPDQNRPLIVTLVFRSGLRRNRINLVLYDPSGESLADEESFARNNYLLAAASGVIYLVDPLALPRIYETLPERYRVYPDHMQVQSQSDMERVLQTIVTSMRTVQGLREDQIPCPAVICLSKADLVPRSRAVKLDDGLWDPFIVGNSKGQLESGQEGLYGEERSERIRDFFREAGGGGVVTTSQAFRTRLYTACSPTGSEPKRDDTTGTSEFELGVSPIRCLDGLIWLLRSLDIIGEPTNSSQPQL